MELSSFDMRLIHYLSRQFEMTARNPFTIIPKLKSLRKTKSITYPKGIRYQTSMTSYGRSG
jgi:hypothetical protein